MSIHVVHVEDERPLRDILGVALRAVEPGIKLEQFISGDEALAYIQTNGKSIDLFVLDIRLPGSLTGIQVAQAIRDLHLPGHIVLTSAYAAPDRDLLATLHGEYYPKPWHLFELTERLIKYRLDVPAPEPKATVQPAGVKPDVAAPAVPKPPDIHQPSMRPEAKQDESPVAPPTAKPPETHMPSVKPDVKRDEAPVAPVTPKPPEARPPAAKPEAKRDEAAAAPARPDVKPGSSPLFPLKPDPKSSTPHLQ